MVAVVVAMMVAMMIAMVVAMVVAMVQYRVKSLGFERDRRVSPPNLSTYHYFQLTMPRQPLRGISGNSNYKGGITDRFELTPH